MDSTLLLVVVVVAAIAFDLHALIGGLLGAGVMALGMSGVNWGKMTERHAWACQSRRPMSSLLP
ncbi:MAG: hypothetical protein ACYC6O_08520 [Thermoleophilia bacterium]